MIKFKIKNYNMILKRSIKISTLSSGNIDKYEYLTGEEILKTHQSRIMEQAKFTYKNK